MADGHMRRTSAQQKWSESLALVCRYTIDRPSSGRCTEGKHKGRKFQVREQWCFGSGGGGSMRLFLKQIAQYEGERQSEKCRKVINFRRVDESLVLVLLAVLNLGDVY